MIPDAFGCVFKSGKYIDMFIYFLDEGKKKKRTFFTWKLPKSHLCPKCSFLIFFVSIKITFPELNTLV